MEPRFEEMTKEQLLAELNVATEKLKYYRTIEDHARSGIQLSPQELSARLAIAEARLAIFEEEKRREEKKREFERRLAEATDFLKANGYEVRQMDAAERFPGEPADLSYEIAFQPQIIRLRRIWL